MKSVIDLNSEEIKVLMAGLHNLVLDTDLLDCITSLNGNSRNTIENLIFKFEEAL